MKSVTCGTCGEVRFEVTYKEAFRQTFKFNKYFDTLNKEQKELYYNNTKASAKLYTQCFLGHSYTQFRDFKEGDCPDGCTQSPIIARRRK